MNKETQIKARKTKKENEKKLFDFMGYEIKQDPRQFIVIKDSKYWYYPTLLHLFRDLRTVETDYKFENGIKLSELVENLEKRDKVFLERLSELLKGH